MTDLKLYTTQETANILRVHRNTIMNYIHSGKLEAIKAGRKYLISESEIKRILEENRVN